MGWLQACCAARKPRVMEPLRLGGSLPSTVIQTSPVHTGLCEDPEETHMKLLEKLVA